AGYTSNVDLKEAMKPNVLVAHRYDGEPLQRRNGAPVRALVPDRYFWKSAKWLTGIRFTAEDHPGYWEPRGYDNHADPWLEERYGCRPTEPPPQPRPPPCHPPRHRLPGRRADRGLYPLGPGGEPHRPVGSQLHRLPPHRRARPCRRR